MTTRHQQHQAHVRIPQARSPLTKITGLGRLAALPGPSTQGLRGFNLGAAGVGATALVGAGLHGALIGGLSAAKWEGAGTGAFFGVGLAGLGLGIDLTVAAAQSPDLMGQALVPGLLFAAVGAGGLFFGWKRFSKARRRR